jgi:hypothetical protein
MQRRTFLIGTCATVLLGGVGYLRLGEGGPQPLLVSTASDAKGEHYVVATTFDGNLISQTLLPKRGHATLPLPHKPNHVLVLARRPDRFALEINVLEGRVTKSFEAQQGHHFYGHGELSSDGQYLYTSENDYNNNRGVIVLRETRGYNVVQQMSSGGIGPHDIRRLPDGERLAIANGGISTHPDWPRMKLDLDTMKPNLSILNLGTGEIEQQYEPPHHHLSLRHLDVNSNGDIYVGAQFQGDYSEQYPLVFVQSADHSLQPLQASDEDWRAMRQYTASVCVDNDRLIVTCPRGDQLTLWSTRSKKLEQRIELKDAAGVTVRNREFMVSSGHGRLVQANANEAKLHALVEGIRFDNHMSVIG